MAVRCWTRRFLRIAPYLIAFLVLWTPTTAGARPAPLEAQEGCQLWVGTAAGNDPSVLVELHICPRGAGVAGHLQWSSSVSGWSRREVQGAWESGNDVLRFRDLRLVENRPQPRWRFCLIENYELRRAGPDRLVGFYRSRACRDTAQLDLRRRDLAASDDQPTGDDREVPGVVGEASDPPGNVSPGNVPRRSDSVPVPTQPVMPPPEEARDGNDSPFGFCSIGFGVSESLPRSISAWLFGSVFLVVSVRRRRIGR